MALLGQNSIQHKIKINKTATVTLMDLNYGCFINSLSYRVEVCNGAMILFFLFVDSIIDAPYHVPPPTPAFLNV